MSTGVGMGEHDSGSQHDFRATCTMRGECSSLAYAGWVYGCPELLGDRLGLGHAKLTLCWHLSQASAGCGGSNGIWMGASQPICLAAAAERPCPLSAGPEVL